MAQLVSVKLSRFDATPWGFRLQGGKDFAQPLVIQKVNGNSLAEKAGLQAGDALIRVNNVDLFSLSHKDAQNALVQAGNNYELTVQRGGSTWKPSVTPVGQVPTTPSANIQPVTKTSLAYKQAPAPAIGSQHNTAAKPFAPGQVNGDTAKNLASKLYNSPVGLYSEETIAETLSAQTEVLAGGVLGVNFKKNEKTYNAANSEVLKMVQEIDNEPREPESEPTSLLSYFSTNSHAIGGQTPRSMTPCAPPPPAPPAATQPPATANDVPDASVVSDTPKCSDCQRFIVGLFVRIKDKNLHVECFKCATCGTSLKNVGYYNINNKLYCDVHAKLVARQNPPAPNLEPVTVPPGVKPPSSVIGSALSSAPYQPPPQQTPLQNLPSYQPQPNYQSQLSQPSPGSPLPSTLGPLPFHAGQSGIRHVNAPRSVPFSPQGSQPSVPAPSTFQAPKLNFNQPPAPVSAPAPRPLSEAQADAGIHYQSFASVSQSSYSSESASQIVSSQGVTESSSFESSYQSQAQAQKKLSICSQEVGTHLDTQNVVKQLSEILEEHDRCPSPTPIDEAVNRQGSVISHEEQLVQLEQQQQWKNYQAGNNLSMQSNALAFLRSHSTPVAELEALYEQQQKEIEEQQAYIKKLGVQKRMSVDETQIRQLENIIAESESEVAQKQKKQEEIEKKKRVRFEEEEEIRRESSQVDQADLQKQKENAEAQRRAESERVRQQEQARAQQETAKRQAESEEAIRRQTAAKQKKDEEHRQHLLAVEAHRDRARTPVADLEAYERHEGMSRKTETIYHTYEHLIEDEEEAESELPKEARPVTPGRSMSPFPGSISGAEKSLLLKNIQGIDFEFALSDNESKKKPVPKTFKLPDLSKLSDVKPYAPPPQPAQVAPTNPPPVERPSQPPVPQPMPFPSIPAPVLQSQPALAPIQTAPTPAAYQTAPIPAPFLADPDPIPYQTAPAPAPRQPASVPGPQVAAPKDTIKQQVKEQKKQVHEEMALNEKFRKKQERLGVEQQQQHFERAKTPVAELEEEVRHHHSDERTHHVYESYDQVLLSAERPRSRIGQPIPENQSITDAEKSLFFQNISGIDYEFENISELTAAKHLPEEKKSLFIRDVEQRTQSPFTVGVNDFTKRAGPQWTPKPDPYQSNFVQALTTLPDPAATASRKSYEQFRHEQELLYKKQKENQQSYVDQHASGIGANKPTPSPLVSALTIAPDRPFSPLPAQPVLLTKAPAPPARQSQPPTVTQAAAPPSVQSAHPHPQPYPPQTATPHTPEPTYDGQRRRSSGFPGVNVQRTPYQMLRGSQIQTSFMEDLVQQKSAISQFMSETEESITKVHRKDTIDAAFGLIASPPQVAYAPPPPADKRAELLASQAQFGAGVEVKPQPPKSSGRALEKPISMTEALTIAPDNSYVPFPEPSKPQATLVYGGSAVALTKSVEAVQQAARIGPEPTQIEIKPIYEMKDLQLNKTAIKGEYTGFAEDKKSSSAEAGTIQGQGLTGSYQVSEQKSSSVLQLERGQQQQESGAPAGFPPVSQDLRSEYEQIQLQQSESAQQSSSQTEKVETVGNVTKTTKRRVVEVEEHSHKEMTQTRVIGGSGNIAAGMSAIHPVSGLRKTSNEQMSKSLTSSSYLSSSGLSKPTTIPTYQNYLADKVVEPLAAAQAQPVDSRDFKPRPKSAIGVRVAPHEPVKVPTAFRSRTPVPLPKIEHRKQEPLEPLKRNLPTYNQDQVFRSASPRPIPVPKAQFGSYAGPQPQHSTLKPASTVYRTTSPLPVPQSVGYKPTQGQQPHLRPASQGVYRSTSPTPVPKMVKTTETYQQPTSSWRVQPVKTEKRVSWPPQEEASLLPAEIPVVNSQSSVKAKISQQEEQAQRNVEEARRSSFPSNSSARSSFSFDSQGNCPVSQKCVKPCVNQQQQQACQEECRRTSLIKSSEERQQQQQSCQEECRRTSLIKSSEERKSSLIKSEDRKSSLTTAGPKTSLVGKGPSTLPGPKHDPIVAPRPFGTPTPQRKIATPHFQPITPVAITEGQNTPISAPKLTFSTSQASVTSSGVERKTSLTLTSSSASAFKPLDNAAVVPVKPLAFRPIPTLAPAPAKAPAPAPTTAPSSVPPARASADNGTAAGAGGGARGATFSGVSAPKRGRGVLNAPSAGRVPTCAQCNGQVRGPFITALGKIWCPDHFICATSQCRRPLADIGFVEEQGQLYCEFCFEKYIAPNCDKCNVKIKGDCLNAVGKHFHPECFTCAYCGKLFGNSAFFLEDGLPYCENDWNELFTTKCFACGFPIEAGDRWVEALNNNYHSQCFNCTVCKKNLEGQSFFAKGGRPFCKAHAR